MLKPQPPEYQDFRNVLFTVWKHLGLPEPTPIQYDIAHWMQHGAPRQVDEAFRGVGKSWIASVYAIDCLRHIPDLNILVVSASKQRADDFSTFCLRLVREVPMFQFLAPREGQRDSKIAFDVAPAPPAHAPSVKSIGITGQITGSRGDIILADDIEVPNNSATQPMRDKMLEAVKEFDAVLKPMPSDDEIRRRAPDLPMELARKMFGRCIYLGTPQFEQSLYNQLPGRGYVRRIWPVRYPDATQMVSYGTELAPMIAEAVADDPSVAGTPTDPKRFPELDLLEREASYGRSGFALQFMLDTSMSDANRYPLKLSDLVVMDLDPDVAPEKVVWSAMKEYQLGDLPMVGMAGDKLFRPAALPGRMVPYQGCIMAIDPSGRGKDETSYAVLKNINGQLFLTAWGGFMGGYTPATLEGLANIAKDHQAKGVRVEANFGDGMFSALLQPVLGRIYPVTVEEVKHSKQKEARIIDTLEPILNQHKLIVARKVVEQDFVRNDPQVPRDRQQLYQGFYQLTRITRDRGSLAQDDRVDALAIAAAYWLEAVKSDVDKRVAASQAEARVRSLREFADSFHRRGRPVEHTALSHVTRRGYEAPGGPRAGARRAPLKPVS